MIQRAAIASCVVILCVSAAVRADDLKEGVPRNAAVTDNAVEHLTVRGKAGLAADTALLEAVRRLEKAWNRYDSKDLGEAASALAVLASDKETALRRHFEGVAHALAMARAMASDRAAAVKHVDLSIAALEKAHSLDPDFHETVSYLGSSYGNKIGVSDNPGSAGMQLGPKATQLSADARRADPTNPVILTNCGVDAFFTPAMWGGGIKRAAGFLEKAIASDPNHADAHAWLAVCWMANGDKEKGEARMKLVETKWPEQAKRLGSLRGMLMALEHGGDR